MEFEGSCPQETMGLVVLKARLIGIVRSSGLLPFYEIWEPMPRPPCFLSRIPHHKKRLMASTRENKSAFCDLSTLHGTEGSLANNSTQDSSYGKCTLLGTSTTRPRLL
ncbi:hypothetical protein NC652_028870 [Populus alba x Populus x berolinensis]|nr:hypothetical protein NC652_028870 [Populus alba x Populus x berolinensis]